MFDALCPPRQPMGSTPAQQAEYRQLWRLVDEMLETEEGRAELRSLCAKYEEIDRCGGLQ